MTFATISPGLRRSIHNGAWFSFTSACLLSIVACSTNPASQSVPSTPAVVAFGDSLTAGNEDGSGVTYPGVLSSLLDETVPNYGIGGQTSGQICIRMGACTDTLTVIGGVIPTSGVTTVEFSTAGYEAAYNAHEGQVEIDIAGVDGYVWNAGGQPIYNFEPIVYPASPVSVSGAVPYTVVLPPNLLKSTVVIWAGRNNLLDPTQVESDITAMTNYVSSQGGTPVVLTVIDAVIDGYQTTGYEDVLAINKWILATYPHNSVDVRTMLVAAYDPNLPADVIDHANDRPPYSLRAIDVKGALASAIDTETCSAAPIATNQSVSGGNVLQLGSELIAVQGVDSTGTLVTSCTRGYAGTTPQSFPAGFAYSGVDPIHLNGIPDGNTVCAAQLGITLHPGVTCAGFSLVANAVFNQLAAMQAATRP